MRMEPAGAGADDGGAWANGSASTNGDGTAWPERLSRRRPIRAIGVQRVQADACIRGKKGRHAPPIREDRKARRTMTHRHEQDDTVQCAGCDGRYRPDGMLHCDVCGTSRCGRCAEWCEHCDRTLCRCCTFRCEQCGFALCDDCRDDCRMCGFALCPDCRKAGDGMCEECAGGEGEE